MPSFLKKRAIRITRHPSTVLALVMGTAVTTVLLLSHLASPTIASHHRAHITAQTRAILATIPHDLPLPPLQPTDHSLPTAHINATATVTHRGRHTATLIRATTNGYNGDITILLAYRHPIQKSLPPALRILSHTETPGITHFLKKTPARAYDGVTGATITATAITRATQEITTWLTHPH